MSDIISDPLISKVYPDVRGAVQLMPFILMKDFGIVRDGRIFTNEKLGYPTKALLQWADPAKTVISAIYMKMPPNGVGIQDPMDENWPTVWVAADPIYLMTKGENLVTKDAEG
jgi:hypothetical protein